MIDRRTCLNNLSAGDIFHAEYPNGTSCICLVSHVDDTKIHATRVTTQEHLLFNRETGIEDANLDQPRATIDSVAKLPPEIHNTFLQMHKRYQALMSMDEALRFKDLDRHKLSEAEKEALNFVHSHYPSNPLPA